jgi:arginase family enzyme
MHIRILDLDGSVTAQRDLLWRSDAQVVSLQDWGPCIRMASSFAAYRRFENACAARCMERANEPVITFYGSGDFHHVTLALLRRLRQPFNLLVLDKHPDWMRGVPVMHCGTWLNHALHLPNIRRVFHLGGDLDFDNALRWLAPWSQLRSGALTVIPAVRTFARGRWRNVPNQSLRQWPDQVVTAGRLEHLLASARADLCRFPLYISLDKDVLRSSDAIVNWDSGHLQLSEVQCALKWFLSASGGRLVGMDILGDWSPVRMRGLMRHVLHWTEHPALRVDPLQAARLNGETNQVLVETISSLAVSRSVRRARNSKRAG